MNSNKIKKEVFVNIRFTNKDYNVVDNNSEKKMIKFSVDNIKYYPFESYFVKLANLGFSRVGDFYVFNVLVEYNSVLKKMDNIEIDAEVLLDLLDPVFKQTEKFVSETKTFGIDCFHLNSIFEISSDIPFTNKKSKDFYVLTAIGKLYRITFNYEKFRDIKDNEKKE